MMELERTIEMQQEALKSINRNHNKSIQSVDPQKVNVTVNTTNYGCFNFGGSNKVEF